MADENLEDEDFDKLDPKSQIGDSDESKFKKSDNFSEEEKDKDELDDLDIEIEGEKKEVKSEEHKINSVEERLGKRRNQFKHRDSRLVRDLQQELNQQRLRNDKLEERLDAVETNTNRLDSSTVDAQIGEAQRYLDQAKATHAQAVKDGDGDRAAEALDVMLEAKETLALLRTNKTNRDDKRDINDERDKVASRVKSDLPQPDPAVMRMFNKWHASNDWYDPALRDKLSRIMFNIDNIIHAEGYDPRTQEYWNELDVRCRENSTLAAEIFNGSDDDQEEQVRMKRQQDNGSSNRSPTPRNDRSSQNGGQRKKIVVSRERAEAMREMGLQPGTAEWKKMAKKYETYDKQRSA